jgi:ATP-dependent DNA ligase
MSQPFAPMLGKDAEKVRGEIVVPSGSAWRYEPKLDGWRWMVHVTADGVRSWSGRNGVERTGVTPYIDVELSWLPDDTVLDGELIDVEGYGATGSRGSPAVASVLADRAGGQFVVFDVLRLAGADVTSRTWDERRALLEKMGEAFDGEVVRTSDVFESDPLLYQHFLEQGFEGVMAKKRDGLYLPGKRSCNFTKVKPQETDEAVVIGFVAGKGSLAGDVGAFEIRLLRNGVETSVATNATIRQELREDGPDSYLGKVIEFAHHGLREDSGKPRHPVKPFRRDDRSASESVRA